ncbi:berberine/berberine-like protein [Tanacetum coccineum]
MMKSQLITSYVLLLLLALCFSVSCQSFFSNNLDVTPGSEDFITCLQSYSNNISSISQLIFTSANSSFLPIWQVAVNNARFNQPDTPKPSVIVTPDEESQIRTALLCTKKHGYEIRIRSGGHDFEGLSSTADVPFVMIDFTNMRSIDVDVANRTAWVQAGAALGEVYYTISQKTDTLYFPAGVCPSVDVVDVRFMDVNGDILDKNSMGEELFWAIRGGGASSFGIVLAWKLRFCEEVKMVQTSLLFGGFSTSTPTETLANRSAINTLNFKGKSDYIREPISIDGLKKIWEKIFENDGSDTFIINPFGGMMSEFSETAIPYPHRAGVLYQFFKTVDFSDQSSYTTPTSLARRDWLQSFEAFLEPYVSSNPREVYFNYNDLDLGVGSDSYEEASVWGERYWKSDNFKKLIQIKARVDPDNLFRHPQSIPVFSTPLSDM